MTLRIIPYHLLIADNGKGTVDAAACDETHRGNRP
jgi:hypothetical protein